MAKTSKKFEAKGPGKTSWEDNFSAMKSSNGWTIDLNKTSGRIELLNPTNERVFSSISIYSCQVFAEQRYQVNASTWVKK